MRRFYAALAAALVLTLPASLVAVPGRAQVVNAAPPATFTILHTNDFHGQLEASNVDVNKASNPGLARTARVIEAIRAAKGANNVLLVDGGDEMQGSLLSNLGDGTATGKGMPTIAAFNELGYDAATFGNHEFDWGQTVLAARTTQAAYPFLSANIVVGTCDASNWTVPSFAQPFVVKTVGTAPNDIRVAITGVTSQETPTITVASATAGLCFKDPAESIQHYYDTMKAQSDVIVVLSHLGYSDGGYGYGIPVYGDQTLATRLNTANKPVNLIIGGHSHTSLAAPGTVVGNTTIVQAAYNGRRVGQADVTVAANGAVSVSWRVTVWTPQSLPSVPASVWRTFTTSSAYTEDTDVSLDPAVDGVITGYATDPDYLAIVNEPVGYSTVDLPRSNTGDNMMGTFVDDAIYNFLNTDAEPTNDVDLFLNNAGGIRTDWCYSGGAWVTTGCTSGTHAAGLLTYGNMFTILPFGNVTIVGSMTGAQIVDVLNHGAQVATSASSPAGTIQPAGLKYSYYAYRDANPGPQPFAWGAFGYTIYNKTTHAYEPIDLTRTYKVGTNEFLAPGGGDGYSAFKYMTGITYWGDMLNAVNAYVSANYGTEATAYAGPNGDGTLDGRIVRDGTNSVGSGSIVPVTILHNNDSHGNLVKGTYVGETQLATLIKQERLHNPTRTLLLNGGDDVQGDAMMYYFKSSYSGFASDGTPLPPELQTNPMMAVMNSLGYDAMVLGNHEFNYGSAVFQGILNQANFPVLGANVTDSGAYGLAAANHGTGVQPYITKTLDGINVAIVGITNHRVPNYELPSNIPGLTFQNPIATAQTEVDAVRASNDVVIALTHIGFTTNPSSVEVDNNVDTNLAAQTTGIDAIVGSHSHTNPANPEAPYKYLPAIVSSEDGKPVVIGQAYRYNNTLGEIVLGLRAKAGGGYEVVTQTGQFLSVQSTTVEDPATKAVVDPYVAQLNLYNAQAVGNTTTPIDTNSAYTQETNGANLQADASVYELASHGITDVDVHLSGAMTNKLIAPGATPASPVALTIADMFAGMPYENSLVVLRMNGPQIKAVLERGYRNYYYYKYVPGRGGYSYYTTCMLDINSGGKIFYSDAYPTLPDGNNVKGLKLPDGRVVNFADATTYYNVSTVNYLAAGSCNMNDAGVSLWPLDQIVHDTQYYVRDATIDYIRHMGTVSPQIEGRLVFGGDAAAPSVWMTNPTQGAWLSHAGEMAPLFGATDDVGVQSVVALLDGSRVLTSTTPIDLLPLTLGSHSITVTANDFYGHSTVLTRTFTVAATVGSVQELVNRYWSEHKILNSGIKTALLSKLSEIEKLMGQGHTNRSVSTKITELIKFIQQQPDSKITKQARDQLVTDLKWMGANW